MARTPSTVASIVSRAYREANITALGTAPTAAQATEGVDNLNSFMSTMLGSDIGEPLADWIAPVPQRTAPAAANWPQGRGIDNLPPRGHSAGEAPYPPINSRIVWGGKTQTVYMPESPDNGSRLSLVQSSGAATGGADGDVLTIDGNGRYIAATGATPPVVTTNQFTFAVAAPVAADWLYVAAYGFWAPIGTLALGDLMTFPPDYDDYFAIGLAVRLAPKYSKSVTVESQAAYLANQTKVKAEFAQRRDTVYGAWEHPNSLQSYPSWRSGWRGW